MTIIPILLFVALLLVLVWHWGYPLPPKYKRGIPVMSLYVCPRPVKIWGFIPTPWICTATCQLINGDTLKCPQCGLEREFQGIKKARRFHEIEG